MKCIFSIFVPNRGETFFDTGILENSPRDLDDNLFKKLNSKKQARSYLRSLIPARSRRKLNSERQILTMQIAIKLARYLSFQNIIGKCGLCLTASGRTHLLNLQGF